MNTYVVDQKTRRGKNPTKIERMKRRKEKQKIDWHMVFNEVYMLRFISDLN